MKNILIIAGSDSVAGAGAQADLKTCEALGCYGCAAITVLVAENSQSVLSVVPVDIGFIDMQLKAITDELNIDAIKIGMLYNKEVIQLIASWCKKIKAPIVFDPVCISKSNIKLIEDDAILALKELFKFATIATPNKFEADILFGNDFDSLECDVVVKKELRDGKSIDILYSKDGEVCEFEIPLATPNVMHGAGCTFSAALACFIAKGDSTKEALKNAKKYVYNAINLGHETKFGKTLLNHKVKV